MSTMVTLTEHELRSELERREQQQTFEEQADEYARSLRSFVYACWEHVVPARMVPTWHIDAICEHLEAAYSREIPRLVITIQPGALKSTLVNVMAPAWRWTHAPHERIVSASHADYLSTRDTRKSRELIQKPWFQNRWGHLFDLSIDENLKTRYSNSQMGYRIATHVSGGTGERGNVLILDDAHNAREVASAARLQEARDWWGDTWSSRLNSSNEDPGVKIVIGQRVHEDDVIGFILDGDPDSSQWVHLCLPARYERNHEYLTAPKRKLPSGREILGDPRTEEGQLLAPEFMDDQTLDQITYDMTELVRQAQYQQRPAPREGNLLKRRLWRYFDPAFLEDENLGSLPTFRMVVASWDTAVKEKTTSDYVVGTAWGFHGADMYLLRLIRQQMSFSSTKTSMKEMRQWVVDRWPNAACYTVIEKASNGVEIIAQLEREIQGVQKYNPGDGGDKTMRAEAALPALESGNCFLPGYQNPEMDGFDARTPAFVQKFVEECAVFNKGKNDDQVDSWSQAVNWARKRGVRDVQVSIPTGSL